MGVFKTLFYSFVLVFIAFNVYRILEPKEDISHITSLPHRVTGNKDSKTMLIFLHGYPNTINMWNKIVELLNPNFLCLAVSYPNYSDELTLRWGMNFHDILRLLRKTIDDVERSSGNKYEKVLVAHDWGSFIAYMFEHENNGYLKDLISFDVSTTKPEDLKSTILTVSYQTLFATAFYIGGPIGDYYTKFFYDRFISHGIYGISNKEAERINSSWNYMYYYLWTNILKYKATLKEYFPRCSTAFFYGKKKPFFFHTEEYLNKVKNSPNGYVEGFEDSGHWFFEGREQYLSDFITKRHS